MVCRLCGHEFLAISYSHLYFRHDWRMTHPLRRYLQQFGLTTIQSGLTARRRSIGANRRWKRLGVHWTRKDVLRKIRKAGRSGDPRAAAASRVIQRNARLYHAAVRLFGSWRRALLKANVDPARAYLKRRWPDGRLLLEELRRAYASGQMSNRQSFNRDRHGIIEAALRHYGSWAAALRLAGIPVRQSPKSWTQRGIRTRILQRHRSGRSVLYKDVAKEDPALMAAVNRILRTSWRRAVESAKVPYPGRMIWTPRRVVQEIRRLRRAGAPVNAAAVARRKSSLRSAALRYFGSWDIALARAGLEPEKIRLWPPTDRA